MIDSLSLKWGEGSECTFEILVTDGGGQFIPVFSGSGREGVAECRFPAVKASEVKVSVTSGSGVLEAYSL